MKECMWEKERESERESEMSNQRRKKHLRNLPFFTSKSWTGVCVRERERERERERWDEMKIEKSDASKWDFEKVKSHCCFALQSWKIMKKTAPFLFSLNITKLNIYFHHKLDGRSKHQQLSMFDPLFDRLLLWILTTSNPSLNPTKRH